MNDIIGKCKECNNIIYDYNILSDKDYVYECPKCLTINTNYELYNNNYNIISKNYCVI